VFIDPPAVQFVPSYFNVAASAFVGIPSPPTAIIAAVCVPIPPLEPQPLAAGKLLPVVQEVPLYSSVEF
jgi:hypothetical protein